jgi:quercetin dioxygenase-like cupin family protein
MKVINYPSLYDVPVSKKMLLEFNNGIVMNLQLKQGEKIPRHLAPCEAIILVNEGKVYFRSGDKEEILKPGILGKFEVEDDHEFEAIENSSIVIVKVNGR